LGPRDRPTPRRHPEDDEAPSRLRPPERLRPRPGDPVAAGIAAGPPRQTPGPRSGFAVGPAAARLAAPGIPPAARVPAQVTPPPGMSAWAARSSSRLPAARHPAWIEFARRSPPGGAIQEGSLGRVRVDVRAFPRIATLTACRGAGVERSDVRLPPRRRRKLASSAAGSRRGRARTLAHSRDAPLGSAKGCRTPGEQAAACPVHFS
jgi:hypothetical protein